MAATNDTTERSVTTIDTVQKLVVGANPRRTLVRAVVVTVMAYLVFGHVLIPVRGEGPSMWPTLEDGQFVLVNRLAYWSSEPRRGDVVALEVAGGRVVYIKRIVGMPGERVRIDRGVVLVNDRALEEPYITRRSAWHVNEVQLGDREYLVIGDNRAMPQRLHDFGKARRERVLGRVISW